MYAILKVMKQSLNLSWMAQPNNGRKPLLIFAVILQRREAKH
jgi:hypothetical protein